jgi:hypothetical protein
MRDEKEEKDIAKTTADLIKAPEAFKKETKWRPWKESVLTYLNAQPGQAHIPLAYIIRERDHPLPDVNYTTMHEELVQGTVLRGTEFNANNGKVYDFLQSLTLNGPAWPWINSFQRTRNGRGAWKALLGYYEGDAMQTRTKQECYQAITKANYQGPRRNYDFSTYVAAHQQAHQDLLRLNEPIPENKKVRDFLAGITDPQCAPIKLNVLSNQGFMNNFLEAVNYIAGAIDMLQKNVNPTFRQLAQVNTNPGNSSMNNTNNSNSSYARGRGTPGRSRGGRMSYRGRGRSYGGPRGGRFYRYNSYNNANSNASSTITSSNQQSGRNLTRGYSPAEWSSLSSMQQ